jgi:hypothetical protein
MRVNLLEKLRKSALLLESSGKSAESHWMI